MKFLTNNIELVALWLMSGGMLLWPLLAKGLFGGGKREIGTLEATRLINSNALVLDVREDAEYAVSHIPNSKHIPLGQLGTRLSELNKYKDKPIIINCRTGMRSGNACRILENNQFTQVYSLKGGLGAWEEAQLPVERAR